MIRTTATALALLLASTAAPAQAQEEASMTEQEFAEANAILARFVEDYRSDPMALDTTFGIKLDEHFWTVSVTRHETASARGRLTDHALGPHEVTLTPRAPSSPTWYFEIANLDVLRMIDTGEINAGTAAMQSFASDEVGVETRDMEGFSSTSGDEADMYFALSHFFTRGVPEVTRFGRANSLVTHGAQATALHMMKGTRIVYMSLGPQEVANADPRLSFGQMPNLFIITSGRGTLNTNDGPMPIEAGMSIYIAPFVQHEIVNDSDEPMEGIVVLYGDNSDFAFGTSYPAFMQDLNQFYREYPFRAPRED